MSIWASILKGCWYLHLLLMLGLYFYILQVIEFIILKSIFLQNLNPKTRSLQVQYFI